MLTNKAPFLPILFSQDKCHIRKKPAGKQLFDHIRRDAPCTISDVSLGLGIRLISRAIGGCRLSASPEGLACTPQLHQTCVLQVPSSPPPGFPEGFPLDGEWLSIFESGFGLRCFQPLSNAA